MRLPKYLAAALVAAALSACALTPPAPVSLHRPNAPLYHASLGATSCVTGAQNIAPVATLTFTPPTTNTDGTAISGPLTFNLYQGTAAGAEIKTQSGITTSPDVINAGLKGGTTYYFELTAVDTVGNESAKSNEGCKAMAPSVPNAFVITLQ